MPSLDLLLMEVLLRGDHLLDLILLLIELDMHLLALILKDKVTSKCRLVGEDVKLTFFRVLVSWCSRQLLFKVSRLRSRLAHLLKLFGNRFHYDGKTLFIFS